MGKTCDAKEKTILGDETARPAFLMSVNAGVSRVKKKSFKKQHCDRFGEERKILKWGPSKGGLGEEVTCVVRCTER